MRGDTVRDWLRYYTNREHLWDDVVAEFYARAADDPQVAPYFTDVDLPRLQRHFIAAMVEHGVPDPAINELKRVIDPLRAAIVAIE